MSTLSVGSIQGLTGIADVSFAPGTKFGVPGQVVQAKYVRSNLRTSFALTTSLPGTTVTELNLTITPTSANSLIVCEWQYSGEVYHDTNFYIHKNGNVVSDLGFEGRNSGSTNVGYGYISGYYDAANNNSTTPHNFALLYFTKAIDTASRTYAPAIIATTGTNTSYFNRAVGSIGADAYENMVSSGLLLEIYYE